MRSTTVYLRVPAATHIMVRACALKLRTGIAHAYRLSIDRGLPSLQRAADASDEEPARLPARKEARR